MADITGVTQRVQTILNDEGLIYSVNGRGDMSLSWENSSTRVFILVWSPNEEDPDSATFVRLTLPVLIGVNDDPEMYKYVALHADDYIMGHLSVRQYDDGDLGIVFTHELLGDYLDAEEFLRAMYGMHGTADGLDDELQPQFGGKRFYGDD